MNCTNGNVEPKEFLLVQQKKCVPTKMPNQRWLILELNRQELNQRD